MKKYALISLVLLVFSVVACGSRKDDCANSDINNFDNFLGINYGTKEVNLVNILGEYTGGQYTEDSSAFIYYFKRMENAPLTVWVNARSSKVETIFMEILSYEQDFQRDVEDAKKEFRMSDCDARFFGMKYEELVETMGEPSREETDKEGVRSLTYDSEDLKYLVNFKIYPSQGDVCSSISVNWFY